jgi:hypothetical protein
MKKLATALLLSSVFFTACKKDDVPTTKEKLQNKWEFKSATEKDFTVNPPATSTYTFPGVFIEFKSDGKLYTSGSLGADTIGYSILNDKFLLIDGDSNEIVTLTANALQLKSVERRSNGTVEYEYLQDFSR